MNRCKAKILFMKTELKKTDYYDINGVRVRQWIIHDIPQNKVLLKYSRENRKAYNLAEIVFLEAGA